jgi:hypothetical protein
MKMRDAPSRRPPADESPIRKFAKWTGGIALMVVVLGAVVVLAMQFFRPMMGEMIMEDAVEVVEVRAAEGSSPALATVVLHDKKIHVPLTDEQADDVVVGSWMQVTYHWIPRTRSARVRGWVPIEPPAEDDVDSPAADR